MTVRIARWVAGLAFLAVTIQAYLTVPGGQVAGNMAARDRMGIVFAVWMLTLIRRAAPRRPSLHGTAVWATAADLKGFLQWGKQPAPGGYLVGGFGRRQLVIPPERTTHHTLLVGPPGTGKSRSSIIPNCALADGSFVVTDPKGEIWRATSGLHQDPWRYAPREPEASRCCNWIPLCTDARLCDLLARAAMQTDREAGAERFWADMAAKVCSALFAHAATLAAPTPASAYAILGTGPRGLLTAFRESQAPGARRCAALLGDLKGEQLANLVVGVERHLDWLKEPAVQHFTSAELTPPDFTALTRQPIGVYYSLHEQDVALLQPLSSLFFTLLLEQLGRDTLETPILILLDEFANIGTLPNFPTTISVARGRGLALVLGVQSLSQLDSLYGEHGAVTIRNSCATKLALHGLDYAGADAISRMLGEQTVQHQQWGSEGRWTEQQVRRPLLTADEVRRLGDDELVALVGNRRPARVTKHWWSEPASTATHSGLGPAQQWTPPETTEAPEAPLGTPAAPKRHLAGRD